MKKFLAVLLVVTLMAGCGVGGYFVRGYIDASQTYSLDSAKEVIRKVAEAGNFLGVEEQASLLAQDDNNNGVATLGSTSNYEDYTDSTVDYNGKESFAKTFISLFYYAVDGEVRANTYYTSTATYEVETFEALIRVTGTMNFYIDLTETQAYFYLTDAKNNISSTLVVSSEDNTTDHYQVEIYITSTLSATAGATYMMICSDEDKITRFAYGELEICSAVNNLYDLNIEDIRELAVFDCNLTTKKIMNKSTTKNNISNQQKMDVVANMAEEFNKVKFIDVVYKDFIEKDFMKRAYESLEYNVVE